MGDVGCAVGQRPQHDRPVGYGLVPGNGKGSLQVLDGMDDELFHPSPSLAFLDFSKKENQYRPFPFLRFFSSPPNWRRYLARKDFMAPAFISTISLHMAGLPAAMRVKSLKPDPTAFWKTG